MKTVARFYIGPYGGISAVATPEAEDITAELGRVTKTRASHVLPAHWFKRIAFRMIRAAAGERGRIAEWCRNWRGPWQVRFARDPRAVVFSHPSRRVCIQWEIDQLQRRFANQ